MKLLRKLLLFFRTLLPFLRKLVPDPLDVLFIAGLGAIVFGVWHIYRPLAWIVGGTLAARYSWLLSAGQPARERLREIEQGQAE